MSKDNILYVLRANCENSVWKDTPLHPSLRQLCNAEVILSKSGKFAIRAKRNIQPNEFIWVDYGKWNNKHNWKIQYEICKARLMLLKKRRRRTANDHNNDNNDQCRKCKKRHEELVMCDSCPVSICKAHITKKEAF